MKLPDYATCRTNQPTDSPRVDANEIFDSLVRQEEAATILAVTPRCLENWRHRGGGPSYVKISARCIRYRRSALKDFIDECVRTNTTDRELDAQ